MLRSFDGLAVRQLATRRLRTALTSFGIVLGVGMVFSVLVLSTTIRNTFDTLIHSAWGGTDLVAMGETGGTMPDSTLLRIQETPGVQRAAGMVGAIFVRLDGHGHAIKGMKGQMMVAGMDPTGPQPYDFVYTAGRKYRGGNDVIVEKQWASDRGVRLGDRIPVATPTGRTVLHVVGVFHFGGDVSFGGTGFAGMALPAARRLMNVPAGWMQVSITANDPAQVPALQTRLQRELGSGVSVKTPSQYGSDIADQLQGLNVVLYFFSGIALFVGGFLILNSFNMTVLQRLRELGMLRTLGATRRMVMRSVLIEALAIGIAGTAAGLLVGLLMTRGLISLMKGFGLPIGSMDVGVPAIVASVVLGIVVTLVGALWPARRAGRIPPIQAVLGTGELAARRPWWRAGLGLALFLPGAILGGGFWLGGSTSTSTAHNMLGIALTMSMFAGMALLAPVLILPLARLLASGLRRVFPTSGRLAADSISRNPTRTAATAIALTIGLSVIVVNSGISSSFRAAINSQIDSNFARDLTVRPIGQGPERGGAQTIPPAFAGSVARIPGVAISTGVQEAFVRLPKVPSSQPALGMGIDPAAYGRVDTTPVRGAASRAAALRALAAGQVLVSHNYAAKAGVHAGDTIVLRGASAVRRVRIAGELDSIANFAGPVVQMSSRTMHELYGITDPAELAIKLQPGARVAQVRRAIDAAIASRSPNLEVLSSADVKRSIRDEFNKQFNMFNAIIAIAVLVSLMGVVNTLAMAVAERTREIGVLRALGASRWLVRRTMLDESLLITISGALAGLAVGAFIGWIWIASVGGVAGISFVFPWAAAASIAVVAIVLGVLASILPARRAARLDVIDALNYE